MRTNRCFYTARSTAWISGNAALGEYNDIKGTYSHRHETLISQQMLTRDRLY